MRVSSAGVIEFAAKRHLFVQRPEFGTELVAECGIRAVVSTFTGIVAENGQVPVLRIGMYQLVDLLSQVAGFLGHNPVEKAGQIEDYQFGQYGMGLPEAEGNSR